MYWFWPIRFRCGPCMPKVYVGSCLAGATPLISRRGLVASARSPRTTRLWLTEGMLGWWSLNFTAGFMCLAYIDRIGVLAGLSSYGRVGVATPELVASISSASSDCSWSSCRPGFDYSPWSNLVFGDRKHMISTVSLSYYFLGLRLLFISKWFLRVFVLGVVSGPRWLAVGGATEVLVSVSRRLPPP